MPRTLLVISGGIEALPGIRRAREMGLRVVVTDGDPDAPGIALADDHRVASTMDAGATLAAARELDARHGLDGVMTLASDTPRAVAAVAADLGLPGPTPETARLATDKLAMKEALREHGVPVPDFAACESGDHLADIARSWGFPLCLKPVDSRGSRGVLRLTADVDLGWAFAASRGHSPTGRVMVERFLGGMQLSSESAVLDGRAATPALSRRNYEYLDRFAPYVIENGGQMPAPVDEGLGREADRVIEAAARAIGLVRGTIKGDLVVGEGRVYVIEVAARLSGGYFCTHQIPAATGVDLVGAAIRMALGEQVDEREVTPRFDRGSAIRLLFAPAGRCLRVRVPPDLSKAEGIELLQVTAGPGDLFERPTDSNGAAGVVVASGDTADQAVERAESAVAAIAIEVEPA